MIITPQTKPALMRSLEADFGSTIAAAIWKKIVAHQNWMDKNVPVGIIMFFYGSQLYANNDPIEPPNGCWQICDGGEVTDANSPLLGQFLPDLRELFLKHGETIGDTGGTDTFTLEHNHGGATTTDKYMSNPDNPSDINSDDAPDEPLGSFHAHSIGMDLVASSYVKVPPYVELQPYMRIV